MRTQTLRIAPLLLALAAAGCASRPLPKYEKPLARTQIQSVRTTAYTHSEADHIEHGRSTALGTRLQCGRVNSAAADWSRWPAGTVFRILETGETFQVDDYGWALAGTNTIDLYKPSRGAMNAWGVRRVTIQNIRWGDPARSLAILRGRSKYRHVKRMVGGFDDHYPSPPALTAAAQPAPVIASTAPQPYPAEAPRAVEVLRATPQSPSGPGLVPFYARTVR